MKKKPKRSAADQAFIESDKHKLSLGDKEINLQPWTPERILHAQTLGMLWPSLDREAWRQFRKRNIYPGESMDLSIFLLLSTLKPGDVEFATREDAKAIGIKYRLHDTESPEFLRTSIAFFRIQKEIQDAATKPKGSRMTDDESDEDEDPND